MNVFRFTFSIGYSYLCRLDTPWYTFKARPEIVLENLPNITMYMYINCIVLVPNKFSHSLWVVFATFRLILIVNVLTPAVPL